MSIYEESYRSTIGTTGKVRIIQNNLNDRYKDAFCITQELLQNADDAGAKHIRIGISDYFSAEHELTNSPGLFYINDGLLTQSDLRQIFNIGDSNKSDATEKIGKFGLGMKSVFHICEAFFIFAYQNEGDLKKQKIAQFFDPWDTPNEEELMQRPDHYQWRKDFENKKEQLFDAVAAHLSPEVKNLKRWFCIWLPLRTQKQYDDSPIFPFLPTKETTLAQFNDQNCIKIARMFPFMKYVQEVVFFGDLISKGTLSIKASRRFSGDSAGKLDCKILSSSKLFGEINVIGTEQLSSLQTFSNLQNDPHWPKTWGIDKAGKCRTLQEKAKPHFAVAIQQQKSSTSGLTVKFFVYLPLTDQHMCETVIVDSSQFPYMIDLNLHAHFFVDAGRQRFETNDGEGKDPVKMAWNREILHKGLLASIHPVFANTLTKKNGWEHAHCSHFIKAFSETNFYQQYAASIAQNSCFVDQLSDKLLWEWCEHSYESMNYRMLPGSIVQCRTVAKAVIKALPHYCLINANATNLIPLERVSEWSYTDVAKLQKAILELPIDKKYAPETIDFLRDFYENHATLTISFLQAYFRDITNLIYKRNEQALNLLLATGKGIICPVRFSKTIWEPKPFSIWLELMSCAEDILPVPATETTECALLPYAGQYSRQDVCKITSKLEQIYTENNNEEVMSALRSVVCNVIRHCSIIPSEPEFANAKIFPAQNIEEVFSLNELLDGYTFTQGDTNIFGCFRNLLPETKIIIVNQDYSLELSKRCPDLKIVSFSLAQHGREIIASKPFIAEDLDLRERIITKLCENPDENFLSIRYLLHRNPNLYHSREELWISNMDGMVDATNTWEMLLKYLLKQREKELTTIPLDLVHSIPQMKHEALKIKLQSPDEVIKSIETDKILPDDFSWINKHTYKHILDQVNLGDENLRRKLRELPIYPVRDGSFTKLGYDTFIETATMIPVEFYNQIKCLEIDGETYQKMVNENLSVKIWLANNTIEHLTSNSLYHNLSNLRELLWDAIEELAQDNLYLNNQEQIDFIKRQKIFKLRKAPQGVTISFNDILPIDKPIDFGPKSANDLGLYYYTQIDQENISKEAWDYVKNTFSASKKEIVEILSERLSTQPEYSAGLFCEYYATPDDFLKAFLQAEAMPLARVIHSLRRNNIPGDTLLQKLSARELPSGRLVDICNYLAHQIEDSTSPLMKMYKEYLRQAANHSKYSTAVLPKLFLFNENWELKRSKDLVHSIEGIAPEYILNGEFTSIIPNPKKSSNPRGGAPEGQEGFVTEARHILQLTPKEWTERTNRSPELLKEYFASWDSALYPYIGAFIVLCDDSPKGCKLAKNYNPQDKKNIRSLLKTETPIGENRYLIFEICSEEAKILPSLTGENLTAHLDAPERIKNLLVGGTWDSCHECRGDGVHKGFHLVLRRLSAANLKKFSEEQLQKLLRATLEVIIAEQTQEPVSLDDLWSHLKKTVQFDLETTQSLILEQLPYCLPNMGLKDGLLKSLLRELDRLNTTRVEAQQLGYKDGLEETGKKIKAVKTQLADLLSKTDDVHKEILLALRSRITKHYGYDVKAVPVELFQNADDATSELLHMMHKTREECALPFVIRETDASVNIIHWGRPINKYNDYGFTEGENLGFRQDLQKMMLLLQSHKEDGDIERTGKFGLGFKSIYLLTDTPHVSSGTLKFSVLGGIFPVKAEEAVCHHLEKIVLKVAPFVPALPASAASPTVIDIPYRTDDKKEILDFEQIKAFAPYLCIFAKAISSIIIMPQGAPTVTYSMYGLRNDGFSKLCFSEQKFGVFSMKSGTIILGIESSTETDTTFTSVADSIPTFWATGPTKECWKLGFVVNSNFSVDVGRTHLIESDNTNIGLARQIGVEFYQHLEMYFNKKFDFPVCNSLWETMTNCKSWNIVLEQGNIGGILREIIWGTQNAPNGYGRFLFKHPVIPLDFEKDDKSLIALKDVKYIANNALSDDKIWNCIRDWAKSSKIVDTKFMLNARNGKFLKMIYKDLDVCELSMADLLMRFYQGISLLEPKTLNGVSWKKLIKVLSDNYSFDLNHLIAVCKSWKFKSEAKTYMNLNELVVKHNPDNPDEDRRYAFAPAENRLNSEYSEDVVAFFVVIREKIGASTETLKKWCLLAENDPEKRQAVIAYLKSGELGDAVAKQLQGQANWIKNYLPHMDTNTASVIAGKMQCAAELYSRRTETNEEPNNHERKNDPRTANWNSWFTLTDFERKCIIEDYNRRVYGTTEIKMLTSNDREEWLKLFVLGMSHRLGRTKIEQHTGFIRFCQNQLDWLDIILNSCNDNLVADDWIDVLNKYLDPSRGDAETYRYWMALYPAIYQISIHLDEYIDAMLQWNKSVTARKIEDVINFRTSNIYRGSYEMPSLKLALGITGSHFVIRELLRSGTVENASLHQFAFVPSQQNFTLLQLDQNEKTSKDIYEFFKSQGLPDPTFHKQFDVAFEYFRS